MTEKNGDTRSITSETSEDEYENWKIALKLCQQTNTIPFAIAFPSFDYSYLDPFDCGTYSQVIKGYHKKMGEEVVLKVIRVVLSKTIDNLFGISFKGSELYKQVINEIVISEKLSGLHNITVDENGLKYQTHTYSKMICAKLVHGNSPNYLIIKKTNDNMDELEPINHFKDYSGAPKEFLVMTLKFCGQPIWRWIKNKDVDAFQLLSIALQLTLGLTVAESLYEFEHRDLHMSNILMKTTKKERLNYAFKSNYFTIKSHGIKAYIIDTTFSRIKIRGQTYFTDLTNSLRVKVEMKKPSKQELVYQNMAKITKNDWQKWNPKTNILWLKYLYKYLITCEIVDNCDNELPKSILKDLNRNISKYKNLENFTLKFLDNEKDSIN